MVRTITPLMTDWIVELAGEDADFATMEMAAALQAEGVDATGPEVLGRHAIISADSPLPALERLAMAHRIFGKVAESPSLDDLLADTSRIAGALDGTYRISLEMTDGTAAEARETIERLASAIDAQVSLRGPDTVLKVIVAPGRVVVGAYRGDSARRTALSRDVMKRPYFSPVSIRSEYARALVNLSRAPSGGTLADPFCGGGGILMEAAASGIRTVGIDIDGGMLEGAATNLERFGLDAELMEGDVSMLSEHAPLDAVATDPPYGRSTSLRDEGLAAIYTRMFTASAESLRTGGHLAVALPAEWAIRLGGEHLEMIGSHPMKVHRSLTRWFTVFRKV